jgi:hypothetical protein
MYKIASLCFLIFLNLFLNTNCEETLMIVNFIRHGNRTPGKLFAEIKDLFYKMDGKKLTLSGMKQMNILGKIYRSRYLENKLINLNSVTDEYLIISSPSTRSIESAIAFTMGLLPDKIYKIHDYNNLASRRDSNPPMSKNFENEFDYFNIIVERSSRNTLFHVKKCKFDGKDFPKNKNYSYLTLEEKKNIFEFLGQLFPETLKNVTIEDFSDKMARSIYSSIRIVNKHYHKQFKIPSHIEIILKRILSHFSYFGKMSNEEGSKIMSSTFFDHLIKFYDNKIKHHGLRDNFFKSISCCTAASNLDFLPKIENEDYSDLKFVTYSGHDTNIAGIIRNFLTDEQLNEYFNNFEKYKQIVHISFGASVDFLLIHKNGEYYVKILLNGKEVFDKIRSNKEGKYLYYDRNLGIKYEDLKRLLESRIYKNIHKCYIE